MKVKIGRVYEQTKKNIISSSILFEVIGGHYRCYFCLEKFETGYIAKIHSDAGRRTLSYPVCNECLEREGSN